MSSLTEDEPHSAVATFDLEHRQYYPVHCPRAGYETTANLLSALRPPRLRQDNFYLIAGAPVCIH